MEKRFLDLTQEEREAFADGFYSLFLKDFSDDRESATPWGCPWEWSGKSLAVSPEAWLEKNRTEIESLKKEEEE